MMLAWVSCHRVRRPTASIVGLLSRGSLKLLLVRLLLPHTLALLLVDYLLVLLTEAHAVLLSSCVDARLGRFVNNLLCHCARRDALVRQPCHILVILGELLRACV